MHFTGILSLAMDKKRAASVLVCGWATLAWGEGCPGPDRPIDTDRPDLANSSVVVPRGSLQEENGANYTRSSSARTIDAPNSRLRLGVAECFEILLDLPNYVYTRGDGPSGFGNVAPAVKWQVNPTPEAFDISAVAGVALPSGARALRGQGAQPYLQFPWSVDVGGEWSVNGMETQFFTPSGGASKSTNQSNLVFEREFGERSFLFGEYVGTFPAHGASAQQLNTGGGYRITPLQQVDFHAAVGLNSAAPRYSVGVGYSLRIDGLF